jgi:hypothetical protein
MQHHQTPHDYLAHSNYDKIETPGAFTRFLWTCAGADKRILVNCTYADHVKYFCLGGIVLATGILAALAGGYAFYTIFQPKGDAIDKDQIDVFTCVLSVIFGLFWGLIIFNLDRFIISSTGKGDGTDAITPTEFWNALPRLLMGSVIALTISKPVEIRMFKTEIDAKLYEKQLELQKEYEKRTTANFEERLKVVEGDLGKIVAERQKIVDRIKVAEQAYTDNLMGKANGVGAGNGPLSKALKGQLDAINDELNRFDNLNATKLNDAEKKRKAILTEKEKALMQNVTVANGLDGLLERLKLAHEIAGFWISLFITLLFMAIELAPIFFKLMMIKSPYDYLDENHKALIIARHGVQKKGHLIGGSDLKDSSGKPINRATELEYDVYLLADKMLEEKIRLLESELKIKQHIIDKHIISKKSDIDAHPEKYIQTEDSSNAQQA